MGGGLWKVEGGGWGVITRVGIYIHVYTSLVTLVIGNPIVRAQIYIKYVHVHVYVYLV